MILQDLIRNVVLYKGVVKPLLQLWLDRYQSHLSKQTILLPLTKLILEQIEANKAISEYKKSGKSHRFSTYFSSSDMSGTRTMSQISNTALDRTSVGANDNIVLEIVQDIENIVLSGKTYFQLFAANNLKPVDETSKPVTSTTGSLSEISYELLNPETHEKREYLGEFSLAHEEIHFLYLLKGGEDHGIDKEPVTTVV